MDSLASLLEKKTVLLADGAWTTELQGRGLPVGDVPEQWNLDHQKEVRGIAQDYASIPVDILTTNTFGANSIRLPRTSTPALQNGIKIAQDAVTENAIVAVSLGPVVAEELGEEERMKNVAAQLDVVKSTGALVCVLESQLSVQACGEAVSQASARGLEVAASFTFFRESDGALNTQCGVRPAEAADAALRAGAIAVGANCCDGPAAVCEAIAEMAAAHPGVALWAKPNAGVPRQEDGILAYPETPTSMGGWALRLADAGARIIGGCCGCGPAHVLSMANALRGSTRP